jgi:hypothetical protein
MEELKIKTPAEFAEEIEELVWQYDIDYIDAVMLYCEQNNLEVETVASLVKGNANLKSRMQTDAENLNFLPKVARLPV